MNSNHAFKINELDIRILAGCNVGLNSFLQLKELWDWLAFKCMIFVGVTCVTNISRSNSVGVTIISRVC